MPNHQEEPTGVCSLHLGLQQIKTNSYYNLFIGAVSTRLEVDAKAGLGVVANEKILILPVVEHRSLIRNQFSSYLFCVCTCLPTGATSQLHVKDV